MLNGAILREREFPEFVLRIFDPLQQVKKAAASNARSVKAFRPELLSKILVADTEIFTPEIEKFLLPACQVRTKDLAGLEIELEETGRWSFVISNQPHRHIFQDGEDLGVKSVTLDNSQKKRIQILDFHSDEAGSIPLLTWGVQQNRKNV